MSNSDTNVVEDSLKAERDAALERAEFFMKHAQLHERRADEWRAACERAETQIRVATQERDNWKKFAVENLRSVQIATEAFAMGLAARMLP